MGFSCGAESVVKCLKGGVVPGSAKGGHVEASPDVSPTSLDYSFASPCSTITIHGSKPYEGRYLLVTNGSQLRKRSQEQT